jgi:hypothetical protein
MNTIVRIAIITIVLFVSCEKSTEEPYTLKFYGDAYEDTGYSVAIANDGYIIAGLVTDIIRNGNFIDSSNKSMGIIKTGWDGNVVWKVSAGGKFDDLGSKILQNPDGSLLCIGTFTDTTTIIPIQTDVFAVKVSSSGNIEWQKHYGGAGNQTGIDAVKTSAGYLILCSTDVATMSGSDSTGNIAGRTDILLMTISDNGALVETSPPYGYSGDDIGVAIKSTNDGNFIVFGTTDRSEPGLGQDGNNLILLKVNSSGKAFQTKIIGGLKEEYAADIEVLSDGYLLAYTIGKDGENQEIWVSKLKNDIYAAPYFTNQVSIVNPNSTDNSAKVFAIAKYETDSFVLSGNSGKSNAAKMLVFEIDATGNLVQGHQVIKGSTGIQVAYDVTSGDDEYVIAVGKNSYDVNSMITLLKFKF